MCNGNTGSTTLQIMPLHLFSFIHKIIQGSKMDETDHIISVTDTNVGKPFADETIQEI